jgi:hypothetical protein
MLVEPYMFTTNKRKVIDNFHTIKKRNYFVLLGFISKACNGDTRDSRS